MNDLGCIQWIIKRTSLPCSPSPAANKLQTQCCLMLSMSNPHSWARRKMKSLNSTTSSWGKGVVAVGDSRAMAFTVGSILGPVVTCTSTASQRN